MWGFFVQIMVNSMKANVSMSFYRHHLYWNYSPLFHVIFIFPTQHTIWKLLFIITSYCVRLFFIPNSRWVFIQKVFKESKMIDLQQSLTVAEFLKLWMIKSKIFFSHHSFKLLESLFNKSFALADFWVNIWAFWMVYISSNKNFIYLLYVFSVAIKLYTIFWTLALFKHVKQFESSSWNIYVSYSIFHCFFACLRYFH